MKIVFLKDQEVYRFHHRETDREKGHELVTKMANFQEFWLLPHPDDLRQKAFQFTTKALWPCFFYQQGSLLTDRLNKFRARSGHVQTPLLVDQSATLSFLKLTELQLVEEGSSKTLNILTSQGDANIGIPEPSTCALPRVFLSVCLLYLCVSSALRKAFLYRLICLLLSAVSEIFSDVTCLTLENFFSCLLLL